MSVSTYSVFVCLDGCWCDVAWIGNDYWQWHKRGIKEVKFCLGVVAQCLVTGLLVTKPEFDLRWKLTYIYKFLTIVEGREEKRLAEERGDYHEGVPAITVIVNGGWSKRSLCHSYNPKLGVAIVIGSETERILHIGV